MHIIIHIMQSLKMALTSTKRVDKQNRSILPVV